MSEPAAAHETLRSPDGQLTIELSGIPTLLAAEEIVELVQGVCSEYAELATDESRELGVAFVAPGDIAALNADHRGKLEPTDVLSFPLDGVEEIDPGRPRLLGDLVLCEAIIIDRHESGQSMVRDDRTESDAARRCLVHGTLHLLGEDHETPEDANKMYALEERALTAWEAGRS